MRKKFAILFLTLAITLGSINPTQAMFHKNIPIIGGIDFGVVPIPFTSIVIDTNKSLGDNILGMVTPILGDLVGFLDPAKPIAAIAKTILVAAKPIVKPFLQKILPDTIKYGAHEVQKTIKNFIKQLDIPILRDIVFPLWELVVGPLDDVAMELVDYLAAEVEFPVAPPRYGGPGEGEPIQIPALKNQIPVGALDSIDKDGLATGWARDPDEGDRFIDVHFYIDGAVGKGKMIGSINANIADHRFSFQIPSEYFDNADHWIHAYGIDTSKDGSQNANLKNTPMRFRVAKKPVGFLENVNEEGKASGWAVGFHDTNVLIRFYIDGPDGKGKFVDSDYTRFIREDVKIEGMRSTYTGFERALPEEYRDGKPHELYAYAASAERRNDLVLLPGSPKRFIMPIMYPVSATNWFVVAPKGGWAQFSIQNIPNKNHDMMAIVKDKIIDFNSEQHGTPFFVPQEKHFISIQQTGAEKTLPIQTYRFKLPDWLEVGNHDVFIKNYGVEAGVGYKTSFQLRVIPYELPLFVTPNSIHADNDVEFTLQKISPNIHFTGSETNVIIKQILLSGSLGSISLNNLTLEEKGNGTLSIKTKIPFETSKIRKGQGQIKVNIKITTKNPKDEVLMQALLIYDSYYGTTWEGKTQEGKDPTLLSECKSSLKPEIEPALYDSPKKGPRISEDKPFPVGNATLEVYGKEFLCFGEAVLSFSATENGKTFPVTEGGGLWSGWGMKADISWDGKVKFIGGLTTEWIKKHNDITQIEVEIKDDAGNNAKEIIPLSPFLQAKIDPLGKKELLPGSGIKLWWKGFVLGHKMALTIDGEPYRNIYLEKGFAGTYNGLSMNFIEDLSIPSWMPYGTHTLLMADISDVDENKKPIYKTATTFVVGSVKKEEPKKGAPTPTPTPTPTPAPVVQPTPKSDPIPPSQPNIELSNTKITQGEKLTIKISNFAPLGVVSIELSNGSTKSKLSGIADYTDSAGNITKTITIPVDFPVGKSTLNVKDTNNLSSSATLQIESISVPAPIPAPTPTPTPTPTPEPEPVPLPDESTNNTPVCSAGSTWSPTFQSCIEDDPTNTSPYAGLPCPPEGTVPSYMTTGCIP